MSNRFQDSLKYINFLHKGNKPNSSEECLEHFSVFCDFILISAINKHKIVISTIDDKNTKRKIDLLEDCRPAFQALYPNFVKGLNQKILEKYLSISTKFLLNDSVSNVLKTQIIDFENQYIPSLINNDFIEVENGLSALDARQLICLSAFRNPDNGIFGDIEFIIKIYIKYIYLAKQIFLRKGQFLQFSKYLSNFLSESKTDIERKHLVDALVIHNSSFHLQSNRELLDFIDDYSSLFDRDAVEYMKSLINSDPRNILIWDFERSHGDLSNNSVKGKEISTIIHFSVPFSCVNQEPISIQINPETYINFYPITEFWSDPMFRFANDLSIGNMNWSHFCEVETAGTDCYTHIVIEILNLYVPHVMLEEESSERIDFSDKEAVLGRSYHPFKEKVIELFIDSFDLISSNIKIDKKNISINMFSNYMVRYIDRIDKAVVHQILFAITNPDSYSKTTTNFIERLNTVNLADSFIAVKELCQLTIYSEKNLSEFVYRALDICVKQSIENHGGYALLWQRDEDGKLLKPYSEPKIQPYIFGQLRAIFDFMGIQISREAKSGNGSIDFLVSYTNTDNRLIRVCVELKLAHSGNISTGALNQLPAYMIAERCSYGIYLTLWFKGKEFDKPNKYKSSNDLESELKLKNTNEKILIMMIDCSKPIEPSKL